ncbi:rhomboid protease PCP1 NDAI_0G01180 [Naumovozyma dairenensis CBS 421]|uniref:Peptidase S54 rhomboid domain-containing protein n=1 Tax=Naumovozyma dairenensis (strain ATCC 10597 / BCRC 20456 / CBS 421 / NBRC 0211 / NRRL Y-12639) TaxID=1071378 RepID=G0WDN3_NAUDC|nr:hypothetical protein NDAI_0G01180 [Naumovozyma dairenensis CBS 421]CCD25894.2 hypothetical protein NDAI_0G01180 [Naumovozyma dairenensis CBS 421]
MLPFYSTKLLLRNQGRKFFINNSTISSRQILKSSIPLFNLTSRTKLIPSTTKRSQNILRCTRFYSQRTNLLREWRRRFFPDTDTSDRYIRLNRFQQYNRNNDHNSYNNNEDNRIRNITLIGLGSMVGIYFTTPYLFQLPPFNHFKRNPKHLVYTLLGLNLFVFTLWQIPRNWHFLQKYMLLQKSNIQSNWSIIGSAFSHQEFWHLGMNMLALWSFGTTLSTVLGASGFFSLYMNSAIMGSLFSLWYPRIARMGLLVMGPSLGASGALFGVLGCFSYLFPTSKILLFVFPVPGGAWVAFLASVVWNGAGCVLKWGSFDYAAHLGGSLIGVAYGWYIKTKLEKQREERRRRIVRSRGGGGFPWF